MNSEQMRNSLLSGADDTPYEDMGKERAKQQWATGEVIRVLQEENARLKAVIAEIVTFTEWARDTDLSDDDWLTELRHPEQITAKMVWDIAQKAVK